MDERLFSRLSARLRDGPVVVASVLSTQGATPRKAGSRMLIARSGCEFSVGGGMAEARVIDAGLRLLQSCDAGDASRQARVDIDLTGKPGAAGVCGGRMLVTLRYWAGDADRARAADIAAALHAGRRVPLRPDDIGTAGIGVDHMRAPADLWLQPDARLLIVGGGHCSHALFELARTLDFDQWVFDPRSSCFEHDQFAGAHVLSGGFGRLAEAFASERPVYAVLLNRDYASDVATLQILQAHPCAFIGMMGSRKRVAEVRGALPDAPILADLVAPVGLPIDAHTPHEIAVSILAQLIMQRRHAGH